MNVKDALTAARALGVERLDAQLLLARHLGRDRSWLIAHDDAPLAAPLALAFAADAARRADGVPLAYLLGTREFHGLPLIVTPAVLVPRPETEHLVDWALECVAGREAPRVLDLGTGSGAIALAIAHHLAHHLARRRPSAEISAVERSPEALAVARRNARALGLAVNFAQGSWWRPVAGRRFDLVVSNPPYVAAGDPHLRALRHEPSQALEAGADGLDDLRHIVANAPAHLAPGAWLLLEHGHDQGAAVRALLAQAGLRDVSTRADLAGLERCSGGRAGG